MSETIVKTPCIGVCSTGIGDSVCRGCKRFAHEVIQWNSYSNEERSFIVARIDDLLAKIVANYIDVVDESLLLEQLDTHQLRVNKNMDAHCLAFEAIRSFGAQLPGMDVIGCKLKTQFADLSVDRLKQAIDQDFYDLSCAHYERYFPGHM